MPRWRHEGHPHMWRSTGAQALDAATGSQRWSATTAGRVPGLSAVAADRDHVYLLLQDATNEPEATYLYALHT